MEFHSPAANLLGFEHAAKNAEQRAKVDELSLTLAKADSLFQVSRSGTCQLRDQDLDLGHLAAESEIEGAEHSDDDHSETHHNEETESHSDIEAKYHYICKQPDAISSLTTSIIDEFPSIETLEVQWIANGKQGASTLDQKQREVIFK